jgi:hypothetical protein
MDMPALLATTRNFLESRIVGYDNHPPSIGRGREAARKAGLGDRHDPVGALAEDTFNPLGRVFSVASVLICTSKSLAGHGWVRWRPTTNSETRSPPRASLDSERRLKPHSIASSKLAPQTISRRRRTEARC